MKLRSILPFAILLVPAYAGAQDSAPQPGVTSQTPPELRDFRLDSPPLPQGPEQRAPLPRERPTPAAETPRPSDSPSDRVQADAAPGVPTANPDRRTGIAPTARRDAGDVRRPAAEAPPQAVSADVVPTAAGEQARDTERAAPTLTRPSPEASMRIPGWIGPLAALLAGLLVAIAGYRVWKKRSERLAQSQRPAPSAQPSPPVKLADRRNETTPEPTLADNENGTATGLSASFLPVAVQLGIASMTVTGRLALQNLGSHPIEAVRMRSLMISAQQGQREAADSFHHGAVQGEIQSLGTLSANERIDATVEFRIPRDELATFRWSEREFVAPIILINIVGEVGEQQVEARVSQLIGRENTAQSSRMKPLPIDRGPRRYSGISARPIFA